MLKGLYQYTCDTIGSMITTCIVGTIIFPIQSISGGLEAERRKEAQESHTNPG
jgi:hypothetical protein